MAFRYRMQMQLPVSLVLVVLAATDAVATTTRGSTGGGEEHQIAIARDGCKDKCGDLRVPYPFGIGDGCYFLPEFSITCNESKNTVPRLMKTRMVVTNISLEDGELAIMQLVNRDCYNEQGNPTDNQTTGGLGVDPPYTISGAKNRFFSVGCDTYAHLLGRRGEQTYTTGCISVCRNDVRDIDKNLSCSGMGCCETKIPPLLNSMNLTVRSYYNHTYVNKFNPCGFAFVVQKDNFTFSSTSFQQLRNTHRLPLVLDWQISGESCKFASQNKETFACKGKENTTICIDRDTGYICRCIPGFQGNPYLGDCEDIDECAPPQDPCKNGKCNNTLGHYTCSCHSGYKNQDEITCIKVASGKPLKISLGTSLSFSVLLVAIFWIYRKQRKSHMADLKRKYFEANGGKHLNEEMARLGKTARIFTEKEVEDATNEAKQVGEGSYGIVYKGVLDKQVVAIKKSKVSFPNPIDQKQTTDPIDPKQTTAPYDPKQITAQKQFVSEMTALYQINHKNVVRLIGCCLETSKPTLVYEFIGNGTLHEHIQGKKGKKPLKLALRLKIAAETAEALRYLHHLASPQIIHGDVKTSNILLDENFTAKLSGFGASGLVPEDENQISTSVDGYVDPEYLESKSKTLTAKSDVYSFGVVLAELLTCIQPDVGRTLERVFVNLVEGGRLGKTLGDEIVEGHFDKLKKAADLAKRCLKSRGEDRPSMEEVAKELQGLVPTMVSGGEADISPSPKDAGNVVGSSASSASGVDIITSG